MTRVKLLLAGVLAAGCILVSNTVHAADQKAKPKPYTLKTCPVSGDKLGEMGAPYVFVYEGREIKLCCKNCLKDFNKTPKKYLKQIDQAEAKAAKEKAAAPEAKPSEKQ